MPKGTPGSSLNAVAHPPIPCNKGGAETSFSLRREVVLQSQHLLSTRRVGGGSANSQDSSQTSEPGSIFNSSRLTSFPAPPVSNNCVSAHQGVCPRPCRGLGSGSTGTLPEAHSSEGGRGQLPTWARPAPAHPAVPRGVTFSGRLCPENHRARKLLVHFLSLTNSGPA